jgi:hypothetical protein
MAHNKATHDCLRGDRIVLFCPDYPGRRTSSSCGESDIMADNGLLLLKEEKKKYPARIKEQHSGLNTWHMHLHLSVSEDPGIIPPANCQGIAPISGLTYEYDISGMLCHQHLTFATVNGHIEIVRHRGNLTKRLIITHGGLSLPLIEHTLQ